MSLTILRASDAGHILYLPVCVVWCAGCSGDESVGFLSNTEVPSRRDNTALHFEMITVTESILSAS
jgi:hypothetical protein